MSLIRKNGWNGILSLSGLLPRGLLDPFICRDIKCIIIKLIKIKGIKKWSEKNRFNVELLIENPPHSHSTTLTPKYGIAEIKFVITVAPQKDICPQGKTYPRKAVAIKINNKKTPVNHVYMFLKDEVINLRLMWIKIQIKKNLAIFIWIKRSSYP